MAPGVMAPGVMARGVMARLQRTAGTPVAAAVGLQSLRAGGNGCLGLACHAMSNWLEAQA
jgi:hypothetical protein